MFPTAGCKHQIIVAAVSLGDRLEDVSGQFCKRISTVEKIEAAGQMGHCHMLNQVSNQLKFNLSYLL
jgi:hypothetical protein